MFKKIVSAILVLTLCVGATIQLPAESIARDGGEGSYISGPSDYVYDESGAGAIRFPVEVDPVHIYNVLKKMVVKKEAVLSAIRLIMDLFNVRAP